ncbi:MAG TPA: alpha/beta fold hydrolase [Candidatus Saccharimonadales bacterium]|nr:alpha/beta fold hydrolase [Candidatus Saccharimonadales bacterium]
MTADVDTLNERHINVGNGHKIYVQDWGDSTAKTPILFLHGGPGSGCKDTDKLRFDASTNRVIFIDQRGSGNSTPTGETATNTTSDLVADIDTVLDTLAIKKVVIVGGSWGSALALAYGITNPDRVGGMVLDGILTATRAQLDWLEKGQWRTLFPEVWEELCAGVPEKYKHDPIAYHYEKVRVGNKEVKKRSVYEVIKAEAALLSLDKTYRLPPYEDFDPGPGLIELHYSMNGFFLANDYLLKNAKKLSMPIYLIQGRYDMVCTPSAAYELDQRLPNSRLIWTINGHSKAHEAANIQQLLISRLKGNI